MRGIGGIRNFGSLLNETLSEWMDHNAPKLGAALAYYSVLAMAPLLIVVLAIVGFALGKEAAQGQIFAQIQGMVGAKGAAAIQTVIANADKATAGGLATTLGIITLFISTSGVVTELHDSLDRIWDIKPKTSGNFFVTLLRDRLFSFGMVLGIGFLLLVSLVASAAIAGAGKYVGSALPLPPVLLYIVNSVFSVVVITVLFAVIYRFIPDERIDWDDVWIGAAFTAILFTGGKFAIGMYLGQATFGSAYGAAGSLVILLAWIYYSAQVFFFGAVFTHVYAKRHGSHRDKHATGAPVVTVPTAVSTPPEQRSPEIARPDRRPIGQSRRDSVQRMNQSDPSSKAFRLASLATLGGLGVWLVRSSGRKESLD